MALSAVACGPVREPVAGPSMDLAVRHQSDCVTEAYPQPLPPAVALLDTARLNGELRALLAQAQRPFLMLGGSTWTEQAVDDVRAFAEANQLPVGCAFRW
ncbi:MAG TPA: hypothetical protein VHG93_01560, partial [Longimicrobium sp.]|nr:hypothetical protein [Longimicrobium sp.]